jgi:hypothetical protein
MRLTVRDAVAALLMAAILTPYAGFLLLGRMPYVPDVRAMALAALAIGTVAFAVADNLAPGTVLGRIELVLAATSVLLGLTTVVVAGTGAGPMLLGAQVTAQLATWGAQMLDHAGYGRPDEPAGTPSPHSKGNR